MPFGARPFDAARGIAVRQELPMPKSSGILAALCLVSATLSVGPPAQAQDAARSASLVPGTKVYDQDGQEIGPIVKVEGDKVAIAVNGSGLVLAQSAFLMTKKGPARKAPKTQIFAVLKEAEADAAEVEGEIGRAE